MILDFQYNDIIVNNVHLDFPPPLYACLIAAVGLTPSNDAGPSDSAAVHAHKPKTQNTAM